ncbi:MAG: hypothetical protein ACI9FR_000378 [Cryomorphaceae bacterium]|jgi:hypothetical protein
MLKLFQSEGLWSCYVGESSSMQLPSIQALIEDIEEFPQCLKDDRRSLVKKGQLLGTVVVAKQPRDKNRRKWARLLSMFRDAEAKKTLKSLVQFEQLGISSVKPICVLEKRENMRVVDSWLIYEFREGRPSSIGSLKQIVVQLNKLHSNGFRHEDPNFGNFLIGTDDVMFLIDCKGKSKGGDFGAYYDFMLLSLRNDGVSFDQVEALIEIINTSPGYLLARAYAAYISARTSLKQRLGRRRSKKDIV